MSDEYKKYQRTATAEMADWHEGFNMDDVSVSGPDFAAGSPKAGDKIARNPLNHADKWLVAAAYFAENFTAAVLAHHPTVVALREAAGKALVDAADALDYAARHCDVWTTPAMEKARDTALADAAFAAFTPAEETK